MTGLYIDDQNKRSPHAFEKLFNLSVKLWASVVFGLWLHKHFLQWLQHGLSAIVLKLM